MANTYWQRQTSDKPLFADMLWSRPENRRHAGKLLIVGGNGYEFKAPANAYGDALNAGVGHAKVLLPDSMQKTVQDLFPEAEFAPHTPSGSFARGALAPALDLAAWADGVLVAGNLGRNSETAIMLESLLTKFDRQITLTHDSLDYFVDSPANLLERESTLLVPNISQLQKLASSAHFMPAFTSDMDLVYFVEALHEFTSDRPVAILTKHADQLVVASGGEVSTTPAADTGNWRVSTAAHAAVWWLQNPGQTYKALTTAVYEPADKPI